MFGVDGKEPLKKCRLSREMEMEEFRAFFFLSYKIVLNELLCVFVISKFL